MNNIADPTNVFDILNLVKEKAIHDIDSGSIAPMDSKTKTKDPDILDQAMSTSCLFFDEMKGRVAVKLERNCNCCGRDVKVHRRRDRGAFSNWEKYCCMNKN